MTQAPDPTGGIGRLYAALWRHAEGLRLHVASYMALLLVAQLIRLSLPWMFAQAVNALQTNGAQDVRTAGLYTAGMLAACIAAWALHGPGRVIERATALRIRERYADALYAKAVSLPLRWHERNHSGATIQRIDKSREALSQFAQHQFVYLQNLVTLVGPLLALLAVSWITGGAAILGYAVVGFILVHFDKRMLRLIGQENGLMRRYNSELVDTLGNISTVLTLRLQAATRSSVAQRLAEVSAPMRRNIVVNEVKWCAIDLLNNALSIGLVALYAWLSWREQGLILVGTAIMIYQYAAQAAGVVGSMATHWQGLMRQKADLATAEAIWTAEADQADAGKLAEGWGQIAVSGLTFTHHGPRGHAPALDDVSITFGRGRRIALVGESGSGKSSLMRVLTGLYAADRITVTVDGSPAPDLRHLGSVALLVPQDPEIFDGTIEQNITMGIDYPPAEIARACGIAELTSVLARLPQGLMTEISERGLNLSGGQKQRLALARAVLAARDPQNGARSLIMLDEPTSSMDPETEARIYDNLLAAFPDACLVSSIHRLHLLDRFHEVVLMAEGRVVDVGPARDIALRQPSFRAMWLRSCGEPTSGFPDAGPPPQMERAG